MLGYHLVLVRLHGWLTIGIWARHLESVTLNAILVYTFHLELALIWDTLCGESEATWLCVKPFSICTYVDTSIKHCEKEP